MDTSDRFSVVERARGDVDLPGYTNGRVNFLIDTADAQYPLFFRVRRVLSIDAHLTAHQRHFFSIPQLSRSLGPAARGVDGAGPDCADTCTGVVMRAWTLGLILARTLDASTTCVALAHGGRDIFPWNQSCQATAGVQAGFSALQIWNVHRLAPAHPRLARVLDAVAIGTEGVAVSWNVRQLRRLK
jgi:hypothetical protein